MKAIIEGITIPNVEVTGSFSICISSYVNFKTNEENVDPLKLLTIEQAGFEWRNSFGVVKFTARTAHVKFVED